MITSYGGIAPSRKITVKFKLYSNTLGSCKTNIGENSKSSFEGNY